MFARIGGMSNEAKTVEYREGWEAALEGKRRAPYPKMSYPYKCWWKGHLDAQERKRALMADQRLGPLSWSPDPGTHEELDREMDQRIAAENT